MPKITKNCEQCNSMEKTIKKDRAENAYLTSRGYGLLKLSEEEIFNGSFRERLPVCQA